METNFTEKSFYCPTDIGNYGDSMQLDSGQELINLEGTKNGYNVEASVRVVGDVRVIFRDQVYRNAGRMPKELLDCYRNHKNPEEIATSDGEEYETPYYCDMNNWLEKFIVVRDAEGKVVDDSYNEVIDFIDDNTPEGWKKALLKDIENLFKDENLI